MKHNALLLFFIAFFLLGCKKEQKLNQPVSSSIKNYADVDEPMIENDMLKFSDQDHYEAWMDYLDEVIARDVASQDTTSQDSLLHEIEMGLGLNH